MTIDGNYVAYGELNDGIAAALQRRYPYVYVESEGGHIWRNWRIYLTQFTQLLFK